MAANRGFSLFVAKLPWTVCRDTLRQHFQQFGKIVSSRVVFDYHNGRSKQYGFVAFESLDGRNKALAESNHTIDGSRVHVQPKNDSDRKGGRQDEDFTEV